MVRPADGEILDPGVAAQAEARITAHACELGHAARRPHLGRQIPRRQVRQVARRQLQERPGQDHHHARIAAARQVLRLGDQRGRPDLLLDAHQAKDRHAWCRRRGRLQQIDPAVFGV